MLDLSPGTLLENRYRILRPLGQGGMSQVYLAEDTRLGVRVAIKENLQTGSAAQSQFREEARILAGLSHPNLPRVSDHFIDARTGRQYLVMDYVKGEDLEQIIERQGPLPETTALAWIRQVMDALAYLHSQRPPVIHRDVKPGNIKITPQGKAMLVDFGVSKVYDPGTPTLTGAQAITPGYAAPEQYGLRTDQRSDIYSLGATLYTTLTGEKPPPSPVLMTRAERLTPPRAIVPNISRSVESVVLRAMETDTSRRWPSMRAFKSELLKAARSRRSPAFAGHYSALLGQPELGSGNNGNIPAGSAWIEQHVRVPYTPQPRLTFQYRVISYDASLGSMDRLWDTLDVFIDETLVFRNDRGEGRPPGHQG